MAAVAAPPLESLTRARTPSWTRWLSRFALAFVVITPFVLLFMPWQQTVQGMGRTTAFDPRFRPQFLVSPIEGRVKSWLVVEGERVTKGQRLAELVDNDPLLEMRLEQERQQLIDRRNAVGSRMEQITVSVLNLEASFSVQKSVQRNFVEIAQEQLNRATQDKIDADATFLAADLNEKRTRQLYEGENGQRRGEGASKRELEVAERELAQAKARVESAKANINLHTNSLAAAKDLLERIEKDRATSIARENSLMEGARADLASASAAITQIDTRIARQRAQYIDSPTDGVVYRLLANADQGGLLVRPGERLLMLVPDIKEALPTEMIEGKARPGIVAELFIDGNDLPLVRMGDQVRLQFEGWPAVQFAAIPEAAAGTFGGRVFLVDPAGDNRGNFRVLIEPSEPWPGAEYLRQGIQVQGWILLDAKENNVSLGWELWRLLNGFPVTRPIQKESAPSRMGPVR